MVRTRLVVLLLVLLSTHTDGQTTHNEPDKAFLSSVNQRLSEMGLFVSCEFRRSGRYEATPVGVESPTWVLQCMRGLSLSWSPSEVRGMPAVSYRVSYVTRGGRVVSVSTVDTRTTLPLVDPRNASLLVEAYDAAGNSTFITNYQIGELP